MAALKHGIWNLETETEMETEMKTETETETESARKGSKQSIWKKKWPWQKNKLTDKRIDYLGRGDSHMTRGVDSDELKDFSYHVWQWMEILSKASSRV